MDRNRLLEDGEWLPVTKFRLSLNRPCFGLVSNREFGSFFQ